MPPFRVRNAIVNIFSVLVILMFACVVSCSAAKVAPSQPPASQAPTSQAPTSQPPVTEAPGSGPAPSGAPAPASDAGLYKTISISMKMEAGAAQYKQWPGGGKTIHAGIGWLEPFGRAEYVAGMDYPETKTYPKPSYMNEEWGKLYKTDLFCIYQLKDGNIYAYDGIVGNMYPDEGDDGRMDYLINVIVGGSGAYEGATGVLLGTTPGRGKNTTVSGGPDLPVSILKLMEGYIKLPIKK